ncbi:hypothetical protein ACQPW1_29545 [Nocardia sp. CA-128927]|uniref:hypothetical protein n=1 Tax=Nocardia sp. CA-128927 TaxID=3239975 RepID=UPI003D9927E5
MSEQRMKEALARIDSARSALLATGETFTRAEGGRVPERSDRFRLAQSDVHAAIQHRNRVLVDLVGSAAEVPIELVTGLGLTGREAASLVTSWRTGSRRVKAHLFGSIPSTNRT